MNQQKINYINLLIVFVLLAGIVNMAQAANKKIGIYYGSFDPIHHGHLAVARLAGEKLELAEVFLLPNITPSHKPNITPFVHRYLMVKRVLQNEPKLSVLPISAMLSFTLDRASGRYKTKRLDKAIETIIPNAFYYHIMGADSFDRLSDPGIILNQPNHHLIVVNRPGYELSSGKLQECIGLHNFHYIQGQNIEVSSSAIRKEFSSGKTPRANMPHEIIPYILENELYINNR